MKDLVCPHCGGSLYINLHWVGPAYMRYQEVDYIECEDWDCGAEWDGYFKQKTASKKEVPSE